MADTFLKIILTSLVLQKNKHNLNPQNNKKWILVFTMYAQTKDSMKYTIKEIKAILKPNYPPGYVDKLIQRSKDQRERIRLNDLKKVSTIDLQMERRSLLRAENSLYLDYAQSKQCEEVIQLMNIVHLHGVFDETDLKGLHYKVVNNKVQIGRKKFIKGRIDPIAIAKIIVGRDYENPYARTIKSDS